MELKYNNTNVTKGRTSLIEKAVFNHFSEEQIEIIEKVELNLDKLKIIYNYMLCQNRFFNKTDICFEIKKYLKLFEPGIDNSKYGEKRIFMYLFYNDCWDRDPFFQSAKKENFINYNYFSKDTMERSKFIPFLYYLLNSNYPEEMIHLLLDVSVEVNEPVWCYKLADIDLIKKDLITNNINSFFYNAIKNKDGFFYDNIILNIEKLLKLNPEVIENGTSYIFISQFYKEELNCFGKKIVLDYNKLEQYYELCKIEKNKFYRYYNENYFSKNLNDISSINEEKYQELEKFVLENNITIHEENYSFKILKTNTCLNFVFLSFRNILLSKISSYDFDNDKKKYLEKEGSYKFNGYGIKNRFEIIYFIDTKTFYMKNKLGKLYPLPVKKIINLLKIDFFEKFIVEIFNLLKIEYCIIKDILREKDNFLLNISLNELILYKTKNELFKNKFKIAKNMNVNFDKVSFSFGYVIIKVFNNLDERSKRILLNIKDETLLYGIDADMDIELIKKLFIVNYYNKKFCTSEYFSDILDYCDLSILQKQKISLCFNSIKKIKNKHDELMIFREKKRLKSVIKNQNPKYKELRKLLPRDFEELNSSRRLFLESKIQSNCVSSYIQKINQGKCVIYSYLDTTGEYSDETMNLPARYTIEFIISNNKIILYQIKGKHNNSDCDKMKNYIHKILNNKLN